MTPEARAWIAHLAARSVRRASAELRLVTEADVLADVLAATLPETGADVSPGGAAEEETDDAGVLSPEAAAGREQLAALDEPELAPLLAAALPGVLAGHSDLASFEGVCGQTCHHAPELLSRSYARILDRKGSPLLLMAEEIRANSRDYPRPVPVELFEAAPFDLTPGDIELTLQAMAASPDYQDISFTTTLTGAVHLFSSLHLERGYAAFLAQRAESLADNP